MANERLKYRFTVARFMPNQLRGEFVNVGIVLHVLDTQQLMSRWIPNLGRMRCLSPLITHAEYKEFRDHLAESYKLGSSIATLDSPGSIIGEPVAKASPELLDYLYREWSVPFQFSEPVFGYTTDPVQQLNHLYEQLVQPAEEEAEPVTHNMLAKVKVRVERTLRKAHLLGENKLNTAIEVPGKTRSWPFHFGRVNGSVTLLEAVLLDQIDPITKSNRAIILNGHVKDVRDKGDYYDVKVYAIVHYSKLPDRMEGVQEARNLIETNGITTLTQEELPKITGELQRSLNKKTYFMQGDLAQFTR